MEKFQTAIIVVTHDDKIIPTFQRRSYCDGITYEEKENGNF
jgi:putative ABC transport system ATP-binding protein